MQGGGVPGLQRRGDDIGYGRVGGLKKRGLSETGMSSGGGVPGWGGGPGRVILEEFDVYEKVQVNRRSQSEKKLQKSRARSLAGRELEDMHPP